MESIEESQRAFYLSKFLKYGDDPRSLSWNDRDSQYLRFRRISGLFKYEDGRPFSVHEVGCGLGHFKDFLDEAGVPCEYSGSDIVPEFIERDRKRYPESGFYVQSISDDYELIDERVRGKDYYCLCGTFNPIGGTPAGGWEQFIRKSMGNMFRMARKGICVSFLTSYSDYYDGALYYADPKWALDYSIRHLSRFVSIAHDLPLFEFFVYVYKKEFIRSLFPGYSKYFGESP